MYHQLQDHHMSTYKKSLSWVQPLKMKQISTEIDLSIACSPNASLILLARNQQHHYLINCYCRFNKSFKDVALSEALISLIKQVLPDANIVKARGSDLTYNCYNL